MRIETIIVPVGCRWRRPWLVHLVPLGVVLGLVSQRLMMAWLNTVLRMACLEVRIGTGVWQPVPFDIDVDVEDDDDDRSGGTLVPAFGGA